MNRSVHPFKTRFFASSGGLCCLGIFALLCGLLSLRFGSVGIEASDFWPALFGGGDEGTQTVLYVIRLPRTLGSFLAGAALAASGVLLQNVTGQSLASPNIIGVNAGAGVGIVLGLSFLPLCFGDFAVFLLPVFAFFGAFLTAVAVALVASRAGGGRSAIVLSGVAVTALLNAVISAATLLDADLLISYNAFSIGGFSGVGYRELMVPALLILLCFVCVMLLGRRIDLLSLGADMAGVMGVRVKALRLFCLLAASAMAASAVSFAGLLGFVGLVVPHMARKLTGNRTPPLLLSSAFLGAAVTSLADLAGRILASPGEIPVGITMALIGAPFFLWLLLRERGKER